MVAFHVAAAVVTLMQYFRLKDRRLLALLALFALLAAGHEWGAGDPWGRRAFLAACAAGLVLLVQLSPRHGEER